MARINEFRRTAAGEGRQQIMGTRGAYHEMPNPRGGELSVAQQIEGHDAKQEPEVLAMWSAFDVQRSEHKADGTYHYEEAPHIYRRRKEDVTWVHDHSGVEVTDHNLHGLPRSCIGQDPPRHRPTAPVLAAARGVRRPAQRAQRQPPVPRPRLRRGDPDRQAPAQPRLARRPVQTPRASSAHESCRRDGKLMDIPDFGKPPAGKPCLDPLVELRD